MAKNYSSIENDIRFNSAAFMLRTLKTSAFGKIVGLSQSQPLALPRCFSLSLNKDAFVADYWCTVSHSRNLGLRRNVLDSEFDNVTAILEILHSWAPIGERVVLNGSSMLLEISLQSRPF